MALPRRTVIIGLTIVGVLALGFVAVALTNPWRLTGLYPLAREGMTIGVLVFAGALLASAGLLALAEDEPSLRWRGSRPLLGLATALVAIPALCVGLPTVAPDSMFRREDDATVLAVSDHGDFSAVKSTVETKDGPRTRIYIRTRAGLFSREAATPVAECPFDPFSRGVPPESVRFTGETTLAIPVADQPTTVVTFDPSTLAPDRTVEMCATGG
jgi:hypothetical protein